MIGSIKKKHIYIGLAVVLLAVLSYYSLFSERPVIVETGSVTVGELVSTIDAEGRTRYHERYVITAPISGKMFRVNLHEGDRIPKGYVLTRIDPSPTRPIDPNQQSGSGINPFAYNVYVPESGILTKIFITSEGIIQSGTAIAEVSKPSKLEIVADVLSTDAVRIRPRTNVIVDNWGGEGPLAGKVRTIEPQAFTKISSLGVEEQRVNVVADFDNVPDRLGDNYRVDVSFVVWEGKEVLRVPASALFKHGEAWSVFVIDGSRAKLRDVEIGHRTPSYGQVLRGLSEGETVIVHPPNSIADGTRVSRN